jgi:uncharacterized protein YnzC (UPF0291/DUF896 family)
MWMKLPSFFRRKKEEAVVVAEKTEAKIEREFLEISQAELKKYIDKHVALVDGKIAASAGTARRALKMAKRKHPGKEVSLRYVGGERLLIPCQCLGKSRT